MGRATWAPARVRTRGMGQSVIKVYISLSLPLLPSLLFVSRCHETLFLLLFFSFDNFYLILIGKIAENTAFSTSFKGSDPGVTLTSTKATFTVSITAVPSPLSSTLFSSPILSFLSFYHPLFFRFVVLIFGYSDSRGGCTWANNIFCRSLK